MACSFLCSCSVSISSVLLLTPASSHPDTSALPPPTQDLPFKKGDVLTVLNTSEDPNWWVAKAKGGKEGMIPANYVELLPDGVGKLERCVLIYILCHSRSEVCECVQNFRISCLGAGRLVLACCQAHPSLYDAFGCRPLLLVSSLIYIYIYFPVSFLFSHSAWLCLS